MADDYGDVLGGLSRGTVSPLADAGYDPDELMADPVKRAEALAAVTGRAPQGAVDSSARTAPTTGPIRNVPTTAPSAWRQGSGAMDAGGQAAGAAMSGQPPAKPMPTPASSQVSPGGSGGSGGGVDWQSLGQVATQGQLDQAGKARGLLDQELAEPTLDQQTADLEAKRLKDATPTPYRDPATGKVLDSAAQFKPTGWQRFGRGVRSAAIGLATGGIPGALVGAIEPQDIAGGKGYGAPNKAYDATEAARQASLASDDQQLSNAASTFKEMTDRRKQMTGDLRAGATTYKDAAGDAREGQKSQTEAEKEARLDEENSPEGKAAAAAALSEEKFTQLSSMADRLGLKGGSRALFLANGKLPDPRQATAEEVARAQALKVFVQKNNRVPSTLDEINEINAAAAGHLKDEGQPGGPPAPQAKALTDEANAEMDAWKGQWRYSAKAGKWIDGTGKAISPQEYTAKKNEIQGKLDTKLTAKKLPATGMKYDPQMDIQRDAGVAATQAAPAGPPPGATHIGKDAKGNVVGWMVNGQWQNAGGK